MEGRILETIEYYGLIYLRKFISIGDAVRIYYQPDNEAGDKLGFTFYVVNWVSGYPNEEWNPRSTSVECLYNGVAYFDGIRHLYMGDEDTDTNGYLYYPSMNDHIEIFTALKRLEDQYCRKD